ncbi:MAG: beta-ketoacyl-[acyl-carrier-protein] synthase family protein [Candidatus Omnitrophica bacterium]|nr:beta-ketoacyl-[acyl-carrier-protein] synthase family protein [Candidatus Omnitrophota bacterium]
MVDQHPRIVITGLGIVAPNGLGKDEFWRNCASGVSGIKPITLFDASSYRCRYAGEISDFHPEPYLGPKGLRNLDRTTLLSLLAAKLAIEDAQLAITDEHRNDIGVVLGSTMGSVHSISEFDKEGLREGPRYVNPAHFPNTVINSPASQVAIRFGLKGLNSTISTGFTASLDAIGYAMDMLQLGRAKALLVGGVEEFCIQTFLGFYKVGFLATTQNGCPPFFAPFDDKRNGALLGEGAVFVVLESLDDAQARGATIVAELLSYSSQFRPESLYRLDPEARGPVAVMREALKDAHVEPDEIDYISACANSTKVCDEMETTALHAVFNSHTNEIPVGAVKSLIGESFSAGGAFQLASTLGALVQDGGQTALINTFGPMGTSAALLVARS